MKGRINISNINMNKNNIKYDNKCNGEDNLNTILNRDHISNEINCH